MLDISKKNLYSKDMGYFSTGFFYHTIETDSSGNVWDIILDADEFEDEDPNSIHLHDDTPVEDYQDFVTWQ